MSIIIIIWWAQNKNILRAFCSHSTFCTYFADWIGKNAFCMIYLAELILNLYRMKWNHARIPFVFSVFFYSSFLCYCLLHFSMALASRKHLYRHKLYCSFEFLLFYLFLFHLHCKLLSFYICYNFMISFMFGYVLG